MLDDFLVRAVLAGIGTALAAAPLGCFIIWRRMAYFGDTTAHVALLGIAIALAFNFSIFIGVAATAVAMAPLLTLMNARGFSSDTSLGVLSHAALAFGLVAVSLLDGVRFNLEAFLFGDILIVSRTDLLVIWSGAALIILLLYLRWSKLLTATLNPELAFAAGISPNKEYFYLTISLALVVAVAIKVVGVLLITSLLIIPAAAARPLARSPEAMALIGAGIGVFAVLGGIQASIWYDTQTGPTIVATAAIIFALSLIFSAGWRKS